MQLTVRDVSELLKVSERTVYRWIKQETIPAYKIHDQYRFNRSEILEWATANKIGVSPELFHEPAENDKDTVSIFDALKRGGIHYRIQGADKPSVLRSVVDVLHLPQDVDRDFLLKVFLAREELGSTGVGDGIAIPHARSPIVLHVDQPFISLCFLEQSVDFGSLDGKPVTCLFTLISPTVRGHLKMLSRIAYILKDELVKDAVISQKSRDIILKEIQRVEEKLIASVQSG